MATTELSPEIEAIASQTVDAAMKVHRTLGPGLLEGAYEACLEFELRRRSLSVLRQVKPPVTYEGVEIEAGYRLDLLVGGLLIVEVKAAESIKNIHRAQVITYLRLCKLQLGLIINFNSYFLKEGIRRVILSNHDREHLD